MNALRVQDDVVVVMEVLNCCLSPGHLLFVAANPAPCCPKQPRRCRGAELQGGGQWPRQELPFSPPVALPSEGEKQCL